VDLGLASVNHGIRADLPYDRWMLFVGGPRLGPAVLFWSVLAVALLLAVGLGRIKLTPLSPRSWMLLGVGLTQASLPGAFIIVMWLLLLGMRRRLREDLPAARFNLMQSGLVILTVMAMASLTGAVKKGLLGLPSMQVAGNGSYGYHLQWFADRTAPQTARAWIFSAPLSVYRWLMLAWALWLASSLIGWIKWGWESFCTGGYWNRSSRLWLPLLRGKKGKD
jgi:hypothetical protein